MTIKTNFSSNPSFDNFSGTKQQPRVRKPRRSFSYKRIFLLFISIFLVLLISYLGISHFVGAKADPQAAETKLEQTMLARLSQLMILPPDAHPVFATVADKTKLNQQAYFENIENNDEVIFFPDSHEAVIYRPSAGKIAGFVPLPNNPAK